MEEFLPSNNVLETICSKENNIIRFYTQFPAYTSFAQFEYTLCSFIAGLSSQIAENFKWGPDPHKYLNGQRMMLVVDGLRNAMLHGSKNKSPVEYGLFMGDLGVCHGFRDAGNYFKSEKIKNIFENKTQITNFTESQDDDYETCHIGVNKNIYPHSDIIEVDNNAGILYCVQLKERLKKSS